MENFKGTKGKWTMERDLEYPALHNIWSNEESTLEKGTLIASTCYAILSEANALLISKAPEMLEALITIRRRYNIQPDFEREIDQLIKEATEI
ncbi:hypothetical protein [Chryseobacterium sp. MYb328]|uniref:hypothetical protein n=1 Tax=Chryseobacterium sp. MYb328 TaxID=2745231 RepID=UPI00309C989A